MPLFHYSHFCRILRQKKRRKMSNVCFLPFANSSVHKVSGNNGSGNYIRHFHKFFISKLWAAEADALLSLLPKKRKKGHKNNPPKRKVTYQHVSAWTNEKKKGSSITSTSENDSEAVVLRRKGQIVFGVKPDHEKIHNNGADTVKRLHIFLWNKVKDFFF